MEQTPSAQPPPPTPPPPDQHQPPPQLAAPSQTFPSSPNPTPNQQQSSLQNSQTRLPFNRPWPQPSPFPHFSSHLQSMPSSSSPSPPPVPPFSSSPTSSVSAAPPPQKGGMAIGVPAHHPSPPPLPTSFSSLNPPPSQVRQPIQGIQGMGTMGSFGSSPQMRSSGISAHHPQRPVQSSSRPQTTPNNQPPTSQNFQAHGMLRAPSVGSPSPSSPSTSQSMQHHNQPWLSSGSVGKPPLSSPPVRSITNSLALQQRSHIPQQHHHSMSTASQQPQASSSQQQQPSSSNPSQEHYPTSRFTQSLPHQQQNSRGPGLGNQKPSSHTLVQPSAIKSGPPNRTVSAVTGEPCNRILSKRTIQELVTQVDPSERLDPEVEEILVDIADEFVESITTFGCSLAKHRKSNTLEAKDILLHLERNWNMNLPGFSGDEIKCYRKPFASDIHRERLAAIKMSMAYADTANSRSSAGQTAGNAKSHLSRAPMNPKIREAA